MWPFSYKCTTNEEIKHICITDNNTTHCNQYYSTLSSEDEYPVCNDESINQSYIKDENEEINTHPRSTRIKNCIQSITDCKNTGTNKIIKSLLMLTLLFTSYKLIFYFRPPSNL